MDDLKRIKKHYGEDMMHLCRKLFPKLLETEGLLYKTLSTTFNPSRFLYGDITRNHYEEQFQNTILSKIKLDEELQEKKKSSKTPEELLKEVGYTLYECKTEDDIQSFRKYYTKKEEILS